ncbi:hypothetical protein SS50377_24346 [Spironucleus salmonicida]|uniref:Uncharacterized protein n=1 Tax=Spironucleus salmonicida TaxID=348837 RepID=V6LN31_9EUKA|nr:hypothetical protein SS50377_24346 [Spironucleus salmonicida]|eukprot:EST46102.1 hypothetical protein SS50377_14096 [Spironucleus salmonicida]
MPSWLSFSDDEFPASLCPFNIPSKNPHIQQFVNPIINADFNPFHGDSLLTLADDSPTAEYRRRKGERKSVSYNRLKRIGLVYIQFLTQFMPENVIINSDANLDVILLLAQMFPSIKFQVYESSVELKIDNVTFHPTVIPLTPFSLPSTSLIYQNIQQSSQLTLDAQNALYVSHLETQKSLILKTSPSTFLIPFQLPWTNETYEFFDGSLHFFPHSMHSHTELALFGQNLSQKSYSASRIEQQMFYFNTITRGQLFNHKLTVGNDGKFFKALDCCYDCTVEIVILLEYCKKIRGFNGVYEVFDLNEIQQKLEFSMKTEKEKEGYKKGK